MTPITNTNSAHQTTMPAQLYKHNTLHFHSSALHTLTTCGIIICIPCMYRIPVQLVSAGRVQGGSGAETTVQHAPYTGELWDPLTYH